MSVDLAWFKTTFERCDSSCPDADSRCKAFVDAINAEIVKAREEQREVCALKVAQEFERDEDVAAIDVIRVTPLTATPLAERIAELENGEPTRCDALVSENAKLRDAARNLRALLWERINPNEPVLDAEAERVLAETEWIGPAEKVG